MSLFAVLFSLLSALTAGALPDEEASLTRDDECVADGSHCTLNALQLQAKTASRTQADELTQISGEPPKVITDLTYNQRHLLHVNLTKFQSEIVVYWKTIANLSKQANATKDKVDKCVYGIKGQPKEDAAVNSEEDDEDDSADNEDVDWHFPGMALIDEDPDQKHRRRRRWHLPRRVAKTRGEIDYEYSELKVFWDTFNEIRHACVYVKQLMDKNRLPTVKKDLTDFDVPDSLRDPEAGSDGVPDFDDPDEEDEEEEEGEDGDGSSDAEHSSGETSKEGGSNGGSSSHSGNVHFHHRRRRRSIPDYKTLKEDANKIPAQLQDVRGQIEEVQGVVDAAGDAVEAYCKAKQERAASVDKSSP